MVFEPPKDGCEFDALLAHRRQIIVDFLRDNIRALGSWKVPAHHRWGFVLTAEKLNRILADEFGEDPIDLDTPPGSPMQNLAASRERDKKKDIKALKRPKSL